MFCLVLMVVVLKDNFGGLRGAGGQKRKYTDVTCDTLESVSEEKNAAIVSARPLFLFVEEQKQNHVWMCVGKIFYHLSCVSLVGPDSRRDRGTLFRIQGVVNDWSVF